MPTTSNGSNSSFADHISSPATNQIQAVCFHGICGNAQVNLTQSPLRADVPAKPLEVEKVLADAPDRVDTSFAVPKVIE